jgi:hypothetical protein
VNANGVPDWVELVANVADSVYGVYRSLGYTSTLNDGGASGGTEYDIFLVNLAPQNVYGYTFSPPDGYMELDNDYSERIYSAKAAAGLRVTLAHELFHSVQFAIWAGGNDGVWWQEVTATFMEDYNFPDINDYWQYLNPEWFCNTFFEDPATPLNQGSTGGCDAHMYGAAVFCQHLVLSDSARGHDAIRYSFERQKALRSSAPGVVVDAIEMAMEEPMRDVLAGFWVRAFFTDGRTPTRSFFPDSRGWIVAPPSKLSSDQWEVKHLSSRGEAQVVANAAGLGAALFRFVPDGSPGGVHFNVTGTSQWAWRVAVANHDSIRIVVPRENRASISNWDAETEIVIALANGSVGTQESQATLTATYDRDLTTPTPDLFALTLTPNRPNPFNPGTELDFSISEPAGVTIGVYNLMGTQIRALVSGARYSAGTHTVSWDGLTDLGTRAAAGMYIVRAAALGRMQARRIILAR